MPAFGFNTPFAEQLDFFRAKLNLPSERWDDIQRAAHDRAFIVAGAAEADLLQDLRNAVDKAIADGEGLEAFRKRFNEIVQKHGWTGWTGQGTKAGEAWRTKVIYQTNMSTSYAAGRYKQLTDPAFLKLMPYWRYVHNDSVMHPRPLHQAWGDMRLTLRYDHPFWQTHFPPNGWGCQCRVTPEGSPDAGAATTPPDGWDTLDPKTGVEVGIDKGFDYAPGANATTPLADLIGQKLINLDADIGAAMWQELRPVALAEQATAYRQWLAEVVADNTAKSRMPVIGAIDLVDLSWLKANAKPLPQTAEIAINSGVINGPKAVRHGGKGDVIAIQVWENLPEMLAEPLAVLYDTENGTLLYVLGEASARKPLITVEFEYARKGVGMNMIVSGYRPFLQDLQARIDNETVVLMRGGLK